MEEQDVESPSTFFKHLQDLSSLFLDSLILYINKTGDPNDRTFREIFANLIQIPIICCDDNNAVTNFKQHLKVQGVVPRNKRQIFRKQNSSKTKTRNTPELVHKQLQSRLATYDCVLHERSQEPLNR